MKLNRASLLWAGLAAGVLLLAPLSADAQPFGMGGPGGRAPFEQLNLSAEQKQALKQIRENSRRQIDAILTTEQRQKLEAHKAEWESRRQEMANLTPEQRQQRRSQRQGTESGQGKGRGPFADLNLDETQRTKIRAIMEESRKQSLAVLTDQQRQQLETMKSQRREHRGASRNQ
jgi:Spy/CpxP family protein refolding chaperone